ncbi:MAG: glycoside hydrolase family 15 protein [Dehalococcoidia bacterium]
MAYKPIRNYGIIGDAHSCALVGMDGSIDWCCFPRFDSPSVFAAILDDQKGGCFQIAPTGRYEARQTYEPYTNILVTTFQMPTGEVGLTDFMPLSESTRPGVVPHEVHRLVQCTRDEVEMACLFQPRFDYGRATMVLEEHPYGVVAKSGAESLSLSASVSLPVSGGQARAIFTLREGQQALFTLGYEHTHTHTPLAEDLLRHLNRTRQYWQQLAWSFQYEGLWRDQVLRSYLLLHLLRYAPTGAIVAAPTTSLPEEFGGQRNWDYRYGWLRDGAWTLGILFRLGDTRDGQAFVHWLLDRLRDVGEEETPIIFGIHPRSELAEQTLDHLEGYRGSRPVRIGNGAATQFQLDVYGEVVMSLFTYHKYGGVVDDKLWSVVQAFANRTCRKWQRPDVSIWEIRGEPRQFVYSKVMCWVALDRAIKLAQLTGRKAPDLERWRQCAREIKAQVLEYGWSQQRQAFVQSYGSENLDAANLLIPFTGFLPEGDPRIAATIKATLQELGQGIFLHRYDVERTHDGLPSEEGAFVMLTFWLVGGLLQCGQRQQALEAFDQILGQANHLGLFSEMIDPATGEFLGNFPQAFSHIGLIHTARNLSQALQRQPADSVLAR